MIINVFDGAIDAARITSLTPVIKNNQNQGNVIDISKIFYQFQVTVNSNRVNCVYDNEADADKERAFVLKQWLDCHEQNAPVEMDKVEK